MSIQPAPPSPSSQPTSLSGPPPPKTPIPTAKKAAGWASLFVGFLAWAPIPGWLYNLYLFFGIDFPNESWEAPYGLTMAVVLYGSTFLTLWGGYRLRKERNLSWPKTAVYFGATPCIWLAIFVLSSVLANNYGWKCC